MLYARCRKRNFRNLKKENEPQIKGPYFAFGNQNSSTFWCYSPNKLSKASFQQLETSFLWGINRDFMENLRMWIRLKSNQSVLFPPVSGPISDHMLAVDFHPPIPRSRTEFSIEASGSRFIGAGWKPGNMDKKCAWMFSFWNSIQSNYMNSLNYIQRELMQIKKRGSLK